MSVDLLAHELDHHRSPNQTVDGVTRSTLDIRHRARAAAEAGFAGIGFTLEDLEAGLSVISWADLKRLCDDLGLVYTEVELITGLVDVGRPAWRLRPAPRQVVGRCTNPQCATDQDLGRDRQGRGHDAGPDAGHGPLG